MTTDHELLGIIAEIRDEARTGHASAFQLRAWADTIEAEVKLRGWQDISTAPKDGTWVAAKRIGKRPFAVRFICGSWQDENNLLRDPTHFYPLPSTLKPTGEL